MLHNSKKKFSYEESVKIASSHWNVTEKDLLDEVNKIKIKENSCMKKIILKNIKYLHYKI